MRSITTLAILATMAAAPLAAQVRGLPVVNNGVPTGIGLAADVNFANQDFGASGVTTFGVSAAVGFGFVGIGGALSRTEPTMGRPAIRRRSRRRSTSRRSAGADSRHGVGGRGVRKAGFRDGAVPSRCCVLGSRRRSRSRRCRSPWICAALRPGQRLNGGSDNRFGIAGGIEFAMLNGPRCGRRTIALFVSNLAWDLLHRRRIRAVS
ncbi:MAG: hypothetical protein IPJ11_16875 [Gemmatimonadetes bacterium]|nr:hypothetical protein [Gemmatimonadota bacterium]